MIDDPEGAVTLASNLLEDVCIAIIEASGVDPKGRSLQKLYEECAHLLGLKVKDHEDPNVQALIGSIAQVALRIGSLRNSASDSHGTRLKGYRPASRHAKLAVNASGATAVFLLDTAKERGIIS
ncbi:MAG: abortive infection family protein [Parvularcula sp.]|nr:abortive infection family protein [Parvularcula sp.]